MAGLNTILDIGKGGLFASQTAISVAGNNIANVNTPGYARQAVRLEEQYAINTTPGQIGTGVKTVEVFRYFNSFVEQQYVDKVSSERRWDAVYQNMRALDSLFNESQTEGINASIAQFWQDWQDLATHPELNASREALLGNSQTLLSAIHTVAEDMRRMQVQMDEFIAQEVDAANDIIKQIAEINLQIQTSDVPGQNNANSLYDRRDQLVRDLAGYLDVSYVDNGGGNFTVMTKAGHVLVDGVETFHLAFENAKTSQELTSTSTFDGDVYFEGGDDFEYKLEVIQAGDVALGGSAAQFRVSLDGGKTWMTDDQGNELHFAARPDEGRMRIGDLSIWFGDKADATADPTGNMVVGDSFTIVPKKGLYWYKTTSTAMNITPQQYANGADNTRRLTGGSLAGYFQFRDENIGSYVDKLDGFAKSFIWEVNRLHSQGAGTQNHTNIIGSYSVDSTTAPLGSNSSGLVWADRLEQGNMQLFFYDASSGALASGASFGSLDFGGGAMFDPSVHSLQDVRDAVNGTWGTFVTASIVNNRLQLSANSGYEFAFGTDTSGLAAALGMNTFFEGTTALDMELTTMAKSDLDFIASGHVNGAGEINVGDNTAAKAIAELKDKSVLINVHTERPTSQTLAKYFNSIVTTVGGDTSSAKFNYQYNEALAADLESRQQETAGVSLDEEMSNLIKFQHSYTAAAKLISAADRMLQTLLAIKN